jgi:hypothetical protein
MHGPYNVKLYTLLFTTNVLHFNSICILCISLLPEDGCKKQLKQVGVVSYIHVSECNLVCGLLVMKLFVYICFMEHV